MSALRSVFAALLLAGLMTAEAVLATEPPPGTPQGVVPPPSIHQQEWEEHALRPAPEPAYPLLYGVRPEREEGTPSPLAPTRTIYGFMPYWVASDISHVQWDLLTHVAYFSVTLNSDGSVTNLSGSYAWPSGPYVAALRGAAHANGVKVTLAANNFDSSSITTLLSNGTYRQNAIDNLKTLVLGYGEGVNIDFENFPSSQSANLVTFMTDLTAAFHSAIPGSHVTLDTPAVDWSPRDFDYAGLAQGCDGLFIMGYDYWYGGSSTAGPCSPLTGGISGIYNVTWTVNDYVTNGGAANKSKFILGLPYYGREWPTSSESVPSSTTGSGTTILYNEARTNATDHGRKWDGASQTPYYVDNSTGIHQGWYDDAESLGYKWDLVNSNDLGGTGMWALNYDTTDDQLWDMIRQKFTVAAGDLAGRKICLDPGHGGTDPGAQNATFSLDEKVVNLGVASMLRNALQGRGATVYMTRSDDSTVSLTARADYANSIPVDRFESVHHNASDNTSANYTGVHIYGNATDCLASPSSEDMAAKTALRLETAMGLGVVSSNCGVYGVHGDNFYVLHYTSMPAMLTEASFISNNAEAALLLTDARRCTEAGSIAKGIEDHYVVSATEPPCAVGTCGNPIQIASFPFINSNDTTGRGAALNTYSCASATNEAGPEVLYTFSAGLAGSLTVSVTDGDNVDIDPHLLSSCSASACIARNDTTFTQFIQPGTYFLSCDTWTSAGGTQYPGPYTLNAAFAADTTAPAVPQSLRWSAANARWQWNATALDRLGNSEAMGYYQMWKSTNPTSAYGLVQDHIVATYLGDSATPGAGICWYYQLHAVDAAGNRDNPRLDWIMDNPQASFAGTWTTGTTSTDKYGSDYRYVGTGGTGTKTATWTFSPEESGSYSVSVYYPQGGNRSSAARFTVADITGSTLHTVNQQVNGGQWVLLGTHILSSGSTPTVVLDDAEPAGYVVIADAVRWTKLP